jgi:hypothetical protein
MQASHVDQEIDLRPPGVTRDWCIRIDLRDIGQGGGIGPDRSDEVDHPERG